jgi:hypothetical protein
LENGTNHTFKVGDKVRVVGVIQGKDGCSFVDYMKESIGNTYTVSHVYPWSAVALKEFDEGRTAFPIECLEPAEYIPQVGDVVEFDGGMGEKSTGIAMQVKWSNYDCIGMICSGGSWCCMDDCCNFTKIGHTDCLYGLSENCDEAYATARAYFS